MRRGKLRRRGCEVACAHAPARWGGGRLSAFREPLLRWLDSAQDVIVPHEHWAFVSASRRAARGWGWRAHSI